MRLRENKLERLFPANRFSLVLHGAESRGANDPYLQLIVEAKKFYNIGPRIRKICEALQTILEFSDSMGTLLEEKGNVVPSLSRV